MGDFIYQDGELYHYGIKGMKWGIRRFQNPDGTLTAEGRKRARQEYRADNKEAFKLGKNATILGRASTKANRIALKKMVKYDKNPSNRRQKKARIAELTAEKLAERAKAAADKAKKHERELMEKYGKEAVNNIRYDKKGRVNEDVNDWTDWAISAGVTAATYALSAVGGSPVYLIMSPSSKNQKARYEYKLTKKEAKRELKNAGYSMN